MNIATNCAQSASKNQDPHKDLIIAPAECDLPMVVAAASPSQIEDVSITVSYEDLNIDTDALDEIHAG